MQIDSMLRMHSDQNHLNLNRNSVEAPDIVSLEKFS